MSGLSFYSMSSRPKLCVVMANNSVQSPGMVLITATRTGKNHPEYKHILSKIRVGAACVVEGF